ncbi:hypothetical protein G3815_001099 [Escherichia coli]|nr:hypothetical protein [Escherichia coli]
MEGGEWRVESGEWRVESGEWSEISTDVASAPPLCEQNSGCSPLWK